MIERFQFNLPDSLSGQVLIFGGAVLAALGLNYGAGQLADHGYGKKRAEAYLGASGYHNLHHTSTDHFLVGVRGCDKNDLVKYDFTAQGANGADLHLIVCKGILKGATIRQR